MIKRILFPMLLLPALSLAIEVVWPYSPQAFAQRRGGDNQERGRGEDRRGGGGRFFGGDSEGRGGRGGRGRFGGSRDGNDERGSRRDSESPRSDRLPRTSSSSSSSSSSRGSGSSLSMDDYVRQLVKERDKDGDMMLKGDEIRGLSGPAARADANSDGIITSDEIAAALRGSGSSNSSGNGYGGPSDQDSENGRRGDRRKDRQGNRSDSSGSGSGSVIGSKTTRVYTALPAGGKGDNGATDDAAKKRTYRFSRGVDHLPAAGLPSWFKSRDADKDGQVEMSEYSRTWSDRTVNEFRRYDLNNDGVVTAKEATSK